MSITSSNNLAVNNSLTVNGNSIFGVDNTSTIICNSKPTFNSDVTISGNINQTSGTFSTGSGNVNLNGDVEISGTKKLTTGTGITTINGITKANNDIRILTGASLYVSNASLTQYLRIHHNLNNSYIDFTGDMILRKNGTMTPMSISSSDNKATFPYGVITNAINVSGTASCAELNCSSINNTGTLATGVLEITSSSSPCYIDMKTTGNNLDYDVRIASSSGVVGTSGQGTLTITSASTIINSPVNVNSSVNCTSINNSGQLTQTDGDVVLSSGRSVFITDGGTNYVRLHHSGISSFLDFNGGLSVRNGGATYPLTISSSNNQGTFNYNLNTTGITNNTNALTNNGTLTQVGLANFSNNIKVNSYIDMKTTSGHNDYDVRLAWDNGSSGTLGAGTLTINAGNTVINSPLTAYAATFEGITNSTSGITNNSTLQQNANATFTGFSSFAGMSNSGNFTNSGIFTQNSTCNINSGLNVSGLPKFDGASTQTLPSTNTGSNSGVAIYWNSDPSHNKGETCFLNMAQGGPGGFFFIVLFSKKLFCQ